MALSGKQKTALNKVGGLSGFVLKPAEMNRTDLSDLQWFVNHAQFPALAAPALTAIAARAAALYAAPAPGGAGPAAGGVDPNLLNVFSRIMAHPEYAAAMIPAPVLAVVDPAINAAAQLAFDGLGGGYAALGTDNDRHAALTVGLPVLAGETERRFQALVAAALAPVDAQITLDAQAAFDGLGGGYAALGTDNDRHAALTLGLPVLGGETQLRFDALVAAALAPVDAQLTVDAQAAFDALGGGYAGLADDNARHTALTLGLPVLAGETDRRFQALVAAALGPVNAAIDAAVTAHLDGLAGGVGAYAALANDAARYAVISALGALPGPLVGETLVRAQAELARVTPGGMLPAVHAALTATAPAVLAVAPSPVLLFAQAAKAKSDPTAGATLAPADQAAYVAALDAKLATHATPVLLAQHLVAHHNEVTSEQGTLLPDEVRRTAISRMNRK